MALVYSEPVRSFVAPDFCLKSTDDQWISLSDFSDRSLLLVMFICNHCPYVIAIQERLNELAKKYTSQKVGFIGINSNDASTYPEDSFEKMKDRAKEQGFVFPYVQDETQEVAKAYGALCTPDLFLFKKENDWTLKYRGRLDDSWKDPSKVTQTDLADAIDDLLSGHLIQKEIVPSMGCSLKWKS